MAIITRAGCVQSSRLALWRKREDEFATAWLLCQLLTDQVRPMQTLTTTQ